MKIGKLILIFLCFWQAIGAQEADDIVVVPPGSTVHLRAASEGASQYQWFRNGDALSGAVGVIYAATLEGKYTVISFNSEGCESDISNEIEIRFSGTSSPPVGDGIQYFCHFFDPVLADIEVQGLHITWYDAEEGGNILPHTQSLEEGQTYYASQSPGGPGTESRERLAVTVFLDRCPDLSVSKDVDTREAPADAPIVFSVKINNQTSIAVRDIVISDRIPSGFSYTSHNADKGSYNATSGIWDIPLLAGNESAELLVHATVLPTGDYTNIAILDASDPSDTNISNNRAEVTVIPSCLRVYNLFSPNGDGMNDTFRIDCIENYPENKLEVYNRYGHVVFRQKGYDNTWKGASNVKNTISRNGMLPVGTYYYVLDPGDGSKPVSGWLYIMR
ncbi:T9SS type B sorting domain-containing protein [Sinomicrobium sp. M5D2P17]